MKCHVLGISDKTKLCTRLQHGTLSTEKLPLLCHTNLHCSNNAGKSLKPCFIHFYSPFEEKKKRKICNTFQHKKQSQVNNGFFLINCQTKKKRNPERSLFVTTTSKIQ